MSAPYLKFKVSLPKNQEYFFSSRGEEAHVDDVEDAGVGVRGAAVPDALQVGVRLRGPPTRARRESRAVPRAIDQRKRRVLQQPPLEAPLAAGLRPIPACTRGQ